MRSSFYRLKVAEVRAETERAKSVIFDVPPELSAAFAWRPGQHITVRFHLDGAEQRRCFSISSSSHAGSPLRITVKQKKDGLVSKHIHEAVEAGDEIYVLPPSGSFCLDPAEEEHRTCYFFAAGSGITPLFSMIGSLLIAEPHSAAHLLYGNADESGIIFREQLKELSKAHEGRLSVCHALSAQSFWSSFKPWRSGRIDTASVGAFIAEHAPYAQDTQYYICGPGTMNADVRNALMDIDVPAKRIHMESYGGAEAPPADGVAGTASTAIIRLAGESHEIAVAAGQTLLQAMRDAGLDPPYSCQAGVCATCRAKLFRGRVHMRSRLALDDDEIEAGDVLTCQSVPLTGEVEVRFPRR